MINQLIEETDPGYVVFLPQDVCRLLHVEMLYLAVSKDYVFSQQKMPNGNSGLVCLDLSLLLEDTMQFCSVFPTCILQFFQMEFT